MTLLLALFTAGLLTILLPCILPLLPVVLGVSIAGRSKWRPLFTVLGMVISFVGFTFLLLVALRQFVELADVIRIATFAALFLFGVGFLTENRIARDVAGVLTGLFFLSKGDLSVIIAMVAGVIVMEVGGVVASRIQQIGTDVQAKARGEFGADSPLTALVIGLTLGLIWVPCAGPALSFALTLVREQPGGTALLSLLAYALGTAVPLLLIGYGGQAAVHSVRSLARYTGTVKKISGVLLIATALALHANVFMYAQVWIEDHTTFGSFVSSFEQRFFAPGNGTSSSSSSTDSMNPSPLPRLIRAPEFTGLGPWHNSEPFTLASLKGKVVLVDFWTYSCINCIRTLPYIQGYWEKYKDTGKFVLLGVHTPEFTFEKSEKNVAMAIKNHGLTYPVAQDNDFGTWSAFDNHYWPAKYLIDANGYVRYEHFGEGGYEETDAAIASLLQEAGTEASAGGITESRASFKGDLTPETYVGARSWPALGNALGEPSPNAVTYKVPTSMTLHKYYLVGDWQLSADGEMQTLRSTEGEIRMKFAAGEINLVLGLENGVKQVTADVFIDGTQVKTLTVTMHDLYALFSGPYGEHELMLKFHSKGVQAFAFTFGQGQ